MRSLSRPFLAALSSILALGFVHRLAYVAAQPATDSTMEAPVAEGAYYVEWARAIVSGAGGPEGAFYLPPLYAYVLALFFRIAGESFALLYLAQHALVLGAAAALALYAAREIGPREGLAAAALAVLAQPLLFFASRPLGEPLALFLLASGLLASGWKRAAGGVTAGALVALAALARASLLPLPLVWASGEALARRRGRGALILAGAAAVLLPVALRNDAASGHLVGVSSNGGITAYHGNGPGADGTFTLPWGFSGELGTQREEATALAQALSGGALDPVEADRFWGRKALGARSGDLPGTAKLLGRRILLLADSHEHGLEDQPLYDGNPWRLMLRSPSGTDVVPELRHEWPILPFAVLLGLAVVGLVTAGLRGTGGYKLWAAIAITLVGPLAFYVSSRYRLPFAALLVIPAGTGLVRLVAAFRRGFDRGLVLATAAGVAITALSSILPHADLRELERAHALGQRSRVEAARGDLVAAERHARLSVERNRKSAPAFFNLGLILEKQGRLEEAERVYRQALTIDPGQAEAAGNLGGMLIRAGKAAKAIPILRQALAVRPSHDACWTNLVIALVATKSSAEARVAAEEALQHGVRLAPGLLESLQAAKTADVPS